MRCVVGFVLVAALVASPLSVNAQEHEEAPKSAALAIHGKSHAPLQLMLTMLSLPVQGSAASGGAGSSQGAVRTKAPS
ncbi:MAG: hypothetical protein WBM47_15465, partial [Polyangiales bacterium]